MKRVGPGTRSILPALILTATGACMLNAQSNTPLNIMPLPAKVERGDGSLKIDASFRIAFAGYREPRLEEHGAGGEGGGGRWLAENGREFPHRVCRLPRAAP